MRPALLNRTGQYELWCTVAYSDGHSGGQGWSLGLLDNLVCDHFEFGHQASSDFASQWTIATTRSAN